MSRRSPWALSCGVIFIPHHYFHINISFLCGVIFNAHHSYGKKNAPPTYSSFSFFSHRDARAACRTSRMRRPTAPFSRRWVLTPVKWCWFLFAQVRWGLPLHTWVICHDWSEPEVIPASTRTTKRETKAPPLALTLPCHCTSTHGAAARGRYRARQTSIALNFEREREKVA